MVCHPGQAQLGEIADPVRSSCFLSHAHMLMNLPFSVFVTGGRFVDPIPIIFKVYSEEIADQILTYGDAIHMIAAASSVVDRVRLVFTLPVGGDILDNYTDITEKHGFYPVAYGRESAVFTI